MKHVFILLALILSLSVLISTTAFALVPENMNLNADIEAQAQTVDDLLEVRMKLYYEETNATDEIAKIDQQLEALGVEILTEQEVASEFPDALSALYGNVAPMVDQPMSNANFWTSYRMNNYYYNGNYYNIQRLRVTPLIPDESVLWQEGGATVTYDEDGLLINAGVENIVETVNTFMMSLIPYVGAAITIYEAFKDIIDGFSATTWLELSDVTYQFETKTTMCFYYVRYQNATDDTQILSSVSSKCETAYAFMMDVDNYVNLDGTSIELPTPRIEAGTATVLSESPNLEDYAYICGAFLTRPSFPENDCVNSIQLLAPGNEAALTIYPPTADFPWQIED